jgi:3-oxoacyl-[acyl-carrier-protein] synthase-1
MVVSNACISGVLAIITAQRLIQSGQYENVIVSGGDLVSEFTLSGFNSFKALSDEPCKPYDAARKGITLGEGCGTLLLTSDENLLDKSNKKISVAGGSVSNDANHISGPSRTGEELALAITNAIKEAQCESAIDFISAHGTATAFNDEMESKAFSVAGLKDVPLNSMKGFLGHTLGAAGVIETVITLETMKRNILLPSLGFENSGVSEPLNIITQTENRVVDTSLKTASGFGGCNAAVIFKSI